MEGNETKYSFRKLSKPVLGVLAGFCVNLIYPMQKLKANETIHLSESVLRALTQNRITTIKEFLQGDISKLAAITKLNLPQIIAVKSEIFAKYSAPVIGGSVLLQTSVIKCRFICTGLERLDAAIGGGIPKGYITELCGLADSGKTQLCFQLAINFARASDSTVLYVDTKGDFSAVRIQKILNASGLSHKEMAVIMSRIRVVRLWTMNELIELCQNIKQKEIEFDKLALMIVDSLPCLMLQFLGDENKIGLKLLNTFVNYSRYLTKELQIGLICVNIQTRWIDQDVIDLEDDGEPSTIGKETYTEKRNRCLGRYWQHIPGLVLLIEKSEVHNVTESVSQMVLSVIKSNHTDSKAHQCNLSVCALGVT